MKNVIEVKNLSKRYGKHRGIEQVSFEVKKGEIFGFRGRVFGYLYFCVSFSYLCSKL